MKKHTATIVLMACIITANAWAGMDTLYHAKLIDSIKVLPETIYPTDSVTVIVFVRAPNSYSSGGKSIHQKNDTIGITCQYYYSSDNAYESGSDTFELGKLSPGNYFVPFWAEIWGPPAPGSYYAFDSTSISFTVLSPTNISTVMEDKISLYPNPTTHHLTITASNFQPESISIYNTSGQRLPEMKYSPQVDVSALPPGIYFIELKAANGVARRKFVKQ